MKKQINPLGKQKLYSASRFFTAPELWQLWGIYPIQDNTALLGVELRNLEKKEVRWCWLNAQTEQCETLEGLPWWGKPHAANAEAVVWQHYDSPKLPIAQGISVWFRGDAAARWSFPQAVAEKLVGDKIKVRLRKQYLHLQLEDGEACEIFSANKPASEATLKVPDAFLPAHPSFEALCQLINQLAPQENTPVAIEVAEIDNAYALASFFCVENVFFQTLWLLDAEGEVVWENRLVDKATGLQSGNFFWFNRQLCFVEEGKALCVVRIESTVG